MAETPPATTPLPGEILQARRQPNGWVYRVDGAYGPQDAIPPERIIGAWKVDGLGRITGAFVPNPKYRKA